MIKKILMTLLLTSVSIVAFADTFDVHVTVTNNTDYTITVVNNYSADHDIAPGSSYSWETNVTNNSSALKFWKVPKEYYMQGGVSFGPTAGVYVDRGWMAADDQSISMTADAQDPRGGELANWTQVANGGTQLLPWNGFTNGGNITLTFNKQ